MSVTIGKDFSHVDSIAETQALVAYTCNVSPSDAELDALEAFVDGDGRIFAIHATTALGLRCEGLGRR